MKTVIYHLVIDESGSMYDDRKKTIASVNHQLNTVRELVGIHEGAIKYLVAITTFNGRVRHRYSPRRVTKIDSIQWEDYMPGGGTALLDAIGFSISKSKSHVVEAGYHASEIEVVMMILTDGYENSSVHYSRAKIAKKIRKLEGGGQWKFIFLGADIDCLDTIRDLNIKTCNTLEFSKSHFGEVDIILQKSLVNHSMDFAKNKINKDFFSVSRKEISKEEILKVK